MFELKSFVENQNNNFEQLYNDSQIEVAKQKEEMEAIIENMFDGVFVVDKNKNVTASSRTMREFINVINFNHTDDLQKNVKYYDLNGNLITSVDYILEGIFRGEYLDNKRVNAYRDDVLFNISLTGSPICDKEGNVVKAVISARDITEQINQQNLIIKQHDMVKLQNETFTNVAHEFKTPLNVIYSSTQIMELYLKNQSLEDKRENFSNNIKIIKQNCYRFIKLINNILDSSKIKHGFLELSPALPVETFKFQDNKIEMINIEFSDIYSI